MSIPFLFSWTKTYIFKRRLLTFYQRRWHLEAKFLQPLTLEHDSRCYLIPISTLSIHLHLSHILFFMLFVLPSSIGIFENKKAAVWISPLLQLIYLNSYSIIMLIIWWTSLRPDAVIIIHLNIKGYIGFFLLLGVAQEAHRLNIFLKRKESYCFTLMIVKLLLRLI